MVFKLFSLFIDFLVNSVLSGLKKRTLALSEEVLQREVTTKDLEAKEEYLKKEVKLLKQVCTKNRKVILYRLIEKLNKNFKLYNKILRRKEIFF